MSDDTAQETFASALNSGPEPSASPGATEPSPALSSAPAVQEAVPAPIPEPQPQPGQAGSAPEGFVPSWRLREIAEERRQLAEEAGRLRQWREEREAEDRRRQEEAQSQQASAWNWENPDDTLAAQRAFAERTARAAVDPVQQQIAAMRESTSQQFAVMRHGIEKVQAAHAALSQALRDRDPEALAVYGRMMAPDAMDPYGDMMNWDNRRSIVSTVGTDLAAYQKRIRDEALKDPSFLQEALNAARQSATPVVTGLSNGQGRASAALRSLNRVTSAADDGDGSDDPQAVFKQALAVRR